MMMMMMEMIMMEMMMMEMMMMEMMMMMERTMMNVGYESRVSVSLFVYFIHHHDLPLTKPNINYYLFIYL